MEGIVIARGNAGLVVRRKHQQRYRRAKAISMSEMEVRRASRFFLSLSSCRYGELRSVGWLRTRYRQTG